jgi:hypothetical protein
MFDGKTGQEGDLGPKPELNLTPALIERPGR